MERGSPESRRTDVRIRWWVAAVVLAAGCGGGSGALAVAGPHPTRTVTGGAVTVTVTVADSGRTITLATGERLRVQLTTGTWDPPTSSSAAVAVRSSSSGGYPTGAPVEALFTAIGPGSAAVTTNSDAACFHSQPACMLAERQWRVRVVVSSMRPEHSGAPVR